MILVADVLRYHSTLPCGHCLGSCHSHERRAACEVGNWLATDEGEGAQLCDANFSLSARQVRQGT